MDLIKQRKDIECMIINKAMSDKKFEELLFSKPSQALKQIGVTVPEEFKLNVIREGKGELTLVYPVKNAVGELSELELVNAAGGSLTSSSQRSSDG